MKKLKFIVPILLLVTLVLVGGACNDKDDDKDRDEEEEEDTGFQPGPGPGPGPQPTDVLTYENDKWDFTIDYPKDWEKVIVDEGSDYIMVGFVTPAEGKDDSFQENVIVLAGKPATSGYSTFDEFVQGGIGEMTASGGKVVSSSKTIVGGHSAQKVVYTASDSSGDYQLLDYFVDGGDVWFLIMYTAEQKGYSEYIDKVEAMVSSLEIR